MEEGGKGEERRGGEAWRGKKERHGEEKEGKGRGQRRQREHRRKGGMTLVDVAGTVMNGSLVSVSASITVVDTLRTRSYALTGTFHTTPLLPYTPTITHIPPNSLIFTPYSLTHILICTHLQTLHSYFFPKTSSNSYSHPSYLTGYHLVSRTRLDFSRHCYLGYYQWFRTLTNS